MINDRIAQTFDEIGNMLEVLGKNIFRVRAYYRGAESVRNFGEDLAALHAAKDEMIEDIPGIGKDLHAKIIEMIETGACEMHTRLLEEVGPGILEILRLRGIGPKKVKLFYDQLGISTLDQLKAAAESGALATLPRMGEKSQESILSSINQGSIGKERIPHDSALKAAEIFIKYMKTCKDLEQIQFAGSLRREKETIGDIDLLVSGTENVKIREHFLAYEKVQQTLGAGETKSSVILEGNMQVDLRIVPSESFGAALLYFTGSKHFNIKLRTHALKQGFKVNEYGLYKGEEKIAGITEQEMFDGLGIDFVPPNQREE
ncbi:MAG: DNA polymerase (family 10) [Oceanicoccus sp.]|jgi:DNA polymerase (family 10)